MLPLITRDIEPSASTLPVYMALFHQASVVSLLETCLFYKEFTEEAGDSVNDLVDYVYRKLLKLVVDADDELGE